MDKNKTPLHIFIDKADIPIAMFDREMRYLAASQCWIERLCGGDPGVMGRSHYDIVPEIPQHWKDMHQRVLAGETLRDESDRFERADGRPLWVRREMRPWHDLNGEVAGIIISAADLTIVVETQHALRASEERLRLAMTAGRLGVFDWDLRTDSFLWGDECYRMLGYQVGEVEPSQAVWLARIHPDDRGAAEAAETTARRERKEFISEYRINRRDGSVRWVVARGRFLYDGDKPVRMIGLKQDITEARQQAETQRVLVGELQHRTRNLMAVVQSIAHQTLHTAESLKDFEARFDRRLGALSRVQSLLSRADNAPITLGALVLMELEALGSHAIGDRIAFGGPEAPLRKSSVEMLTLAIHELLTNAIKYGALASDTGRLSVTWRIEGAPPHRRLVLEWIERGMDLTALAADAGRSGYGRALIEEALPYSLAAETKFDLGSHGLLCLISLPFATKDDVDGMHE